MTSDARPGAHRLFIVLLTLDLAAAIALTIVVASDDVLGGELRVLRELQTWSFLGGWLADAVRFVTTTGVVTVCGAIAAVMLWMIGERRAAIGLAAAILVLQILQPSIKELVDQPRPSEQLGIEIRASITSPSFPSGHVMSPTVVYGFLAGLALLRPAWPRVVRVAIIAMSVGLLLLTGLVNLYLGVHWPTDVLGGWLWGGAIVLAALLTERTESRVNSLP